MPEWINDYKSLIASKLLDEQDILEYALFHDCGKPYCHEIDSSGKQHFPNHASISEKIWLEHGGSVQIGRLIGMDMDIHLLKAEGLEEFSKRPEAITLLLAGLSEIHSNASMFGGIESTSFKIKYKQIEKRGMALCKLLTLAK